jgi:hemin uptake protein HemP
MNPTSFTFTVGAGGAAAVGTAITLTASSATLTPSKDTDRLTPFTYDVDAVYSQHLQFNGQDRLDKRFGDYYNEVQPFQHHTGSTSSVYRDANGSAISTAQPGVYCYSFALKPEEQQPSGTCNFSRIDTATIVMSIDGKVPIDRDGNEYDVRVYATNYNILRIMSGMAGLAYSN